MRAREEEFLAGGRAVRRRARARDRREDRRGRGVGPPGDGARRGRRARSCARPTRHRLVIEVNPDDLELVSESAEGLAARLGGVQRLDVVAERRVERGGCIVRTEEGEIDARIGSQLQQLRRAPGRGRPQDGRSARLEAA